MTAFGHKIITDYATSIVDSSSNPLPVLQLLKCEYTLLDFEHLIAYEQNQGRDVSLSTNFSFSQNLDKQRWHFKVSDVVTFKWEKGSSRISYNLGSKVPIALLEYWFLHTLLPIYLTIEGKYEFIHAGGVEIDFKPVLFIAPSYGGKSTLTDYFIQQLHPMISDDRVGLFEEDQKIMSVPSYPFHRPYRKMEDLGVHVDTFSHSIKPLHLIYALERGDAKEPISFTQLKGIEKFKALQYNFDFDLPLNKVKTFELIGKIASSVPVYKISIPSDLSRLSEVYQKICHHLKNHP